MPPKYNICQILDRGVFPHQWTSYRLRTQTLYFDSDDERYELKRYLPNHPKYQKGKNFCLSKIKPEYNSGQKDQVRFRK